MTPFEQGFSEELEKIAIDIGQDFPVPFPTGLPESVPAPGLAEGLFNPQTIGLLLKGLEPHIIPPPYSGHVYKSFTTPAMVSEFRYR